MYDGQQNFRGYGQPLYEDKQLWLRIAHEIAHEDNSGFERY